MNQTSSNFDVSLLTEKIDEKLTNLDQHREKIMGDLYGSNLQDKALRATGLEIVAGVNNQIAALKWVLSEIENCTTVNSYSEL